MKKLKLKKDNKGFSLVLVMGVIAIVTILVTVILAIGLSNYLMRMTNRASKENFYDAEQVLDEICLGLQQDVSDAMSEAYVDTYSNYLGKDALESETYFNDSYLKRIREKVEDKGRRGCYDMDHLLSFLDDNVKKNTTLETSKGRMPALTVNSNGAVLKNLYLTYVNDQNYVSRVATDIQIRIPNMNLSYSDGSPKLLQYSMVADGGIRMIMSGTLTADGNLYAGYNGKTGVANASFYLQSGTLDLKKDRRLVVEDTLYLDSGSSPGRILAESGTEIWAKDMKIANDKSEVDLKGTAYLANDLDFLMGGRISVEGKYYGFGNPQAALQADVYKDKGLLDDIREHPSDYSSAIMVNGNNAANSTRKASMNLKSIDALMVAGNAYIGSSKVVMGESLTAKINQIAYLVPESCMEGATNPMTLNGRNTALGIAEGDSAQTSASKENDFRRKLLFNVQREVSPDVEEIVQMVDQKGFYYYYMRFASAKAADQYFASHYQGSGAVQIKNYLNMYLKQGEVGLSPDAEKIANGNILVYDEDGIGVVGDTIAEGSQDVTQDRKVMEQLVSYQNMFGALNTNLSLDYGSLTGTQKARGDVYENILDTTLFSTVAGGVWLSVEEGGRVYVGYIANGDKDNYEKIIQEMKKKYGDNAQLCLLVTEEDLWIEEDCEINGLIVCRGRIWIKASNVQCRIDPVRTAKLFTEEFQPLYFGGGEQMEREDEVYTLMDFMYDADSYLGKSVAVSDRSGNAVELEKLVNYVNWSKQ